MGRVEGVSARIKEIEQKIEEQQQQRTGGGNGGGGRSKWNDPDMPIMESKSCQDLAKLRNLKILVLGVTKVMRVFIL